MIMSLSRLQVDATPLIDVDSYIGTDNASSLAHAPLEKKGAHVRFTARLLVVYQTNLSGVVGGGTRKREGEL